MKTNSNSCLQSHAFKKTESQMKQAQEYFQKYMKKVDQQKSDLNPNIFGFNQGSTECSSKNTSSLFDKTANFGKVVSTNLLLQNVSDGPKQFPNLRLLKQKSNDSHLELCKPVQSSRELMKDMKINMKGVRLQKIQRHNNFFPEKQEKQEQQKRRVHLEYSQNKLVNRLFDEQGKKSERKQSADKVFIVRKQNSFRSQFIE